MAGPLAGIRVVEVAQVISGALCAMLLGEQGADVVKVEQPGGDPTRNSGDRRGDMGVVFFNCNRGKRSVVLDLTTEAGRELLFDLVRDADVFIQNFRPGKAAKLGIGPTRSAPATRRSSTPPSPASATAARSSPPGLRLRGAGDDRRG